MVNYWRIAHLGRLSAVVALVNGAAWAAPAQRFDRLLRQTLLLRDSACRQLRNSRFFGRHRPDPPRIDRRSPALPLNQPPSSTRRIPVFYLGRVARRGARFGPRVASRALLRTAQLP